MKKNIKMSNFAPCGPIFKIRNSKLVYSKSYKQITDYISRPIDFGKKVKFGDKGGTSFPIEVGHYYVENYLKEKYWSGKTREKAFLMTKIMRSKNLNP